MLARFFASFMKLCIASLALGAGLSVVGFSLPELLARVGQTPESAAALVRRGVEWALPNIVLGAVVVVPLWIFLNLLRPPAGND